MKRKNRIMFVIIYALFLFVAWQITETSSAFTFTKTYKGKMTVSEESYVEPTEETTTKKEKTLQNDKERDDTEEQPFNPKTEESPSPTTEESPDREKESTHKEDSKETSDPATEK